MPIDNGPAFASVPRLTPWMAAACRAALVGALFSLPATWPSLWPLGLLGTAWLAAQCRDATTARAAALSWSFGIGWLLAATWWLFISMHRYGDLPAPLAALAVLALSAALAGYLALAMGLFAMLRTGRRAADAALFGALWLAAELARGVVFTGFPWAAPGYGQVDGPLAAWAPWVGVYGIGALVATLGGWFGLASTSWRARLLPGVAIALCLVGSPLIEHDFTASAGRVGVSLIQTNVAQDEKFAALRLPEALSRLAVAVRDARGPLVVAPETAIPLLPDELGDESWQALTGSLRAPGRAGLLGLPLGSYETGYTNSVAGLSAQSAARPGGFYRYDKHHLVPFGEFIPNGFHWFVALMNIPLGDFARGPALPETFDWGGQRIAPNICYEDLFGEELALRFRDVSRAPTLLANVSNIGWFGDTIAIDQHLHISRMRSLELQRPMIRATNTGATAAIDHRGRVTAKLAAFTRGVLEADVDGRTGLTPYARIVSTLGLWPFGAIVVFTLAVFVRTRVRRKQKAGTHIDELQSDR
jgi:apolipoprotein N-acyltransferase